MAITASTFISDTVKFIRDDLDSNVTDPVSASRSGRERFVMTSYPQRPVLYPIITVVSENVFQVQRLGIRSEGIWFENTFEIRVWARNMKEKDDLTEKVLTRFRTNQFGGAGPSVDFGLHDLTVLSVIPVDEPGDGAIKSSVITISFKTLID